jgi:hypothetical protein
MNTRMLYISVVTTVKITTMIVSTTVVFFADQSNLNQTRKNTNIFQFIPYSYVMWCSAFSINMADTELLRNEC